MNYSKWDMLAREEEQAEKTEKQRQAQMNKEKYMKEQEERKAKFLEDQKAKKKEAKRIKREQLAQQQQQQHTHHHDETCNDPNHDHSQPHSHGHGHGDGDEHNHSHSHDGDAHAHGGSSHDGHAHGGPSSNAYPPPSQDDDSDSDIDENQFRRGCSCGYADPEELKKRVAAAAKEPQLTLEEKNIKKKRAVEATREHGNQLFKEGNYTHAYQVYERGVLICNGIYGLEPAAADAMTQLECTLNLNMAACKLKLKEWQQAIDTCKLALQLHRTSVKAYYRMGEAYIGMGEYDLAEEKLNEALKLEPHNKTTQDKIKEVGTLRIKQEEKQKQTEEQMRQNMKAQIMKMKQQQQIQQQTIQPTCSQSSSSSSSSQTQVQSV